MIAENKPNYEVYGSDDLESGDRFKIEHSISLFLHPVDISDLVAMSLEDVLEIQKNGCDLEQALFDALCEQTDALDKQMAENARINMALQYLHTKPSEHTSNQWVKQDHCDDVMKISNMVYEMTYHIYEDTKYDRKLEKSIPVAWYLTWDVTTNAPRSSGNYAQYTKIAGQDRKKFTEKEAMEKYLEGRIKKYSNLFEELSPAIPPELANVFKVNGVLLPGYTMAES